MNKVERMRASVDKVTRLLSNRSVDVVQQGMTAKVVYNNDGTPRIVYIPELPDNASDQLMDAVQGFIDHEVAHILFTDRLTNIKASSLDEATHGFFNCLEDTFIERKMAKSYKGSSANLRSTQIFAIEKLFDPVFEKAKSMGLPEGDLFTQVLLAPAIRAWSGQEPFERYMADKWHLIKNIVGMIGQETIGKIPQITATVDSYNLALEITKKLKNPEPPNSDNKNKDGDSSQSESDQGDQQQDDNQSTEADNDQKEEQESNSKLDSEETTNDDSEESSESGSQDDNDSSDDPADSGNGDDHSDDENEGEESPAGQSDSGDSDGDNDDAGSGGDDSSDSSDESSDEAGGDSSDDGNGDSADDNDGGGAGDAGSNDSNTGDDYELVDVDLSNVSANQDHNAELIAVEMDQALQEAKGADRYIVWSRHYDKIAEIPNPQATRERGKKYNEHIKDTVDHMIAPIAKDLERCISANSRSFFVPGFKSGRLHNANLFKLKTGDNRVFRKKEEHTNKDVAVTLLIDASGSMKGRKLDNAVYAAYGLASSLDRIGIACEVLSFTTEAMNGNSHRQLLIDQNNLPNGLTYARQQIIKMPLLKGFDEKVNQQVLDRLSWAKEGMRCRNNIDEESIKIAAERLSARQEEGKIMMVLSDGLPSGTQVRESLINSRMKKTINTDLPNAGIDVIGIGLNTKAVTKFYKKNVVIKDVSELASAVMNQLKPMLLSKGK